MKRLMTFIITVVLTLSVSAQTDYIYERRHKDATSCLNVLELNDGSIIEVENQCTVEYPDGDCGVIINTFGTNIIKMDESAAITDSLFVEFPCPGQSASLSCLLAKNPHESGSYILADFYHNEQDGKYHYAAIFFDDDLNVTDAIDEPFKYDNVHLDNISQIFIDHNNDLVFCANNSGENIVFIKIDIYGKLLGILYSELSSDNYRSDTPAFIYDEEQNQYGFLFQNIAVHEWGWSEGGAMTVIVLDENMDIIMNKGLYSLTNKIHLASRLDGAHKIISLPDGNFAMFARVINTSNGKESMQLSKLNRDFELMQYVTFAEGESFAVSIDDCMELGEDGSIYVVWCVVGDYDTDETEEYVAYVDSDFNIQWERRYFVTEGSVIGAVTLYSTIIRENGGLVIGGYNIDWNALIMYPILFVVDGEGELVSEHFNSFRPYSFYPNPANEVINIRFSPDVNAEKVEIYGMDGKLYHEQNFNMETVDVNSLSRGIYMMKVTFDNGSAYTDKIVVK